MPADYEHLSTSQGEEFMPMVENFFFKPQEEDDFFVEPWENRDLADCSLFVKEDEKQKIYFFTDDEDLISFLLESQENDGHSIYLYGAYNQVVVCQLRAKGSVGQVSEKFVLVWQKKIERKLCQAFHNKCLSGGASADKSKIVMRGKLFCFTPTEYAATHYERG